MNVNFNGGMQAQGFGGVKPNVTPNVNNEDIAVNEGELHGADNNRPEGETRTKQVDMHSDGTYTIVDNGDGKRVVKIKKPDGETVVLDYEKGEYNGVKGYSEDELDGKQHKHGVYPPVQP